jgi:hypothetical protein
MATKEMLASIISGRARQLAERTDEDLGMPMSPGARNSAVNESKKQSYGYSDREADAMFSAEYDDNYADADDDIPYATSITNEDIKRSALPNNILESITKNPIDKSGLSTSRSVVDSLGVQLPKKKPAPKQQVNEQNYHGAAGGGVDYSIIKAIVNECLASYFNNNSLNENALKTIGIKKGKITLVDNSGNVYQARLEKIGNKNEIGD